jgi:hypothetical protein
MLSGRGLCDELITRPEESYRLWYVVACVWTRNIVNEDGAWPTEGCCAKRVGWGRKYIGYGNTRCPNFVMCQGVGKRGEGQNKDLLSRNCTSEMRPCSTADLQIGSDRDWKSSKTSEIFWKKQMLYFLPIKSRCSNVRPPTSIHNWQRCCGDRRVRWKIPGCLFMMGNKINWNLLEAKFLTIIFEYMRHE